MSQIINITRAIHDSIIIKIPYVNITSIQSIQILHKCNDNHDGVIKINCSLLENEDNYGLIGHIFTNSKLDINDDHTDINIYTDTIRIYLTDLNDNQISLHEDIYVSLLLEIS